MALARDESYYTDEAIQARQEALARRRTQLTNVPTISGDPWPDYVDPNGQDSGQTTTVTTPTADTSSGTTNTVKDPNKPIIERGMGPNPEDPFGGTGPIVDPKTAFGGGTTGQQPTTPTAPGGAGMGDPLYNLSNTDIQALLQARPDIASAYQQAVATADRNSPVFLEKGLDSLENYARYWYGGMGGYKEWNPLGGQTGGVGGDPNATGNDLITSLTNGFNQQIAQLQQQSAAQLAALQGQNQQLAGSIQQQQQQFAQSQQQLLDQMTRAAAQQSQQFQAALKGIQDAGSSTGQAAKKPNYGRALQRNKELNGQGVGSTMLTGPGGVAPGSMSLGFTSLLGA